VNTLAITAATATSPLQHVGFSGHKVPEHLQLSTHILTPTAVGAKHQKMRQQPAAAAAGMSTPRGSNELFFLTLQRQ
jgi:hypothetical protein